MGVNVWQLSKYVIRSEKVIKHLNCSIFTKYDGRTVDYSELSIF